MNSADTSREDVARIIRAYDRRIVRCYCHVRFRIMRQRFLEEIGMHLPEAGTVLDIGSGFGLFSLYYALQRPELHIVGCDIDARRIAEARRAAARLGLQNVTYAEGDAADLRAPEGLSGAYMLDIVHHIPRAAVAPLLGGLYTNLAPGARLVIKDVDRTPAWKRGFTFVLDKAVAPRSRVRYWGRAELETLCRRTGFEVTCRRLVDVLPYPHLLYVCTKRAAG
jgi:ubiquinone/menaquinone biosynthesis C-methylase UbiE